MGEKGKERVKKEFSMEKMVNSFVGLYKSSCYIFKKTKQ
jgi:hypothetical protein